MAQPYITIGSLTTGGGTVISGQSTFLIEGKPIACVGDKATCPKHQCVSTIVSGDNHLVVMGKPAAQHNSPLSCGCKCIGTQNLHVGDNGGGLKEAKNSSETSMITNPQQSESFVDDKKEIHKIQFQIMDDFDQKPIQELLYEIYSKESGELLVKGYTDQDGFTAIYESELKPESVELITLDLSRTLDPI